MCDMGDATRCRTRVTGPAESTIEGVGTVVATRIELGDSVLVTGCAWMLFCPASVDGSLLAGIPLDCANFIGVEDLEWGNVVTPAFAGGDMTARQSPLGDIAGETGSCAATLAGCCLGWKTTAAREECVMCDSALVQRMLV